MNQDFQLICPFPKFDYKAIMLAHGGGGKLSHSLIKSIFMPQFDNEYLNVLHDGAIFEINGNKFAFTTDSYIVSPIFFPGGNIGELAINGTVNDLAMCGAKPLFISAGFIIEEGLLIEDLWKIVESMRISAVKAGVSIVTGDTKVVEKGKCDKMFINTSGIGIIERDVNISPRNAQPGDLILINGKIAEHGMAIMSVREGFEFESPIVSDTAPLNDLVNEMFKVSRIIHVLRDPTRGGLATVLNEIAQSSNCGIIIEENKIPISEQVRSACEILGFDPLYVANEGKLVAFVPKNDANALFDAMRQHPLGKDSAIIGRVTTDNAGLVAMKTSVGSTRIVDMLSGEQMPRIC